MRRAYKLRINVYTRADISSYNIEKKWMLKDAKRFHLDKVPNYSTSLLLYTVGIPLHINISLLSLFLQQFINAQMMLILNCYNKKKISRAQYDEISRTSYEDCDIFYTDIQKYFFCFF